MRIRRELYQSARRDNSQLVTTKAAAGSGVASSDNSMKHAALLEPCSVGSDLRNGSRGLHIYVEVCLERPSEQKAFYVRLRSVHEKRISLYISREPAPYFVGPRCAFVCVCVCTLE